MRKQLEQLAWLLLTNYVVRNADCHSKNIALYYTTATDVAYTPAYDIVTTQAYPAYAANPPGLSIDGRKTWTAGKTLERFFNTRLGITPKTYHLMVEQLCDSAVSVAQEMIEAANDEKQWRWIARQMLHAWNDGMASLRSAKPIARLRSLTPLIEAAGFSDADKAESLKTIIGRSELLASRDKNS
jgi:serine/threonine-protein kinase HipA